jgi:hypothetical protein
MEGFKSPNYSSKNRILLDTKGKPPGFDRNRKVRPKAGESRLDPQNRPTQSLHMDTDEQQLFPYPQRQQSNPDVSLFWS